MILQTLVVAIVVVGSACYAAWTLMPSSLRRSVAAMLLRLPLPAPFAARMRKHSVAGASGCGCDGCDAGTAAKTAAPGSPPAAQPISFHPRLRR